MSFFFFLKIYKNNAKNKKFPSPLRVSFPGFLIFLVSSGVSVEYACRAHAVDPAEAAVSECGAAASANLPCPYFRRSVVQILVVFSGARRIDCSCIFEAQVRRF